MDLATRQLVRERAKNRCEYCHLQQEYYELAFHIEHVIASQHRLDDTLDNLALACDRCNLHKGINLTSIDLETDEMVTLFNPRTETWKDHFDLIGSEIIGISTSGRATVRLLNMNSERRLLLRRQFIEEGREFE